MLIFKLYIISRVTYVDYYNTLCKKCKSSLILVECMNAMEEI